MKFTFCNFHYTLHALAPGAMKLTIWVDPSLTTITIYSFMLSSRSREEVFKKKLSIFTTYDLYVWPRPSTRFTMLVDPSLLIIICTCAQFEFGHMRMNKFRTNPDGFAPITCSGRILRFQTAFLSVDATLWGLWLNFFPKKLRRIDTSCNNSHPAC